MKKELILCKKRKREKSMQALLEIFIVENSTLNGQFRLITDRRLPLQEEFQLITSGKKQTWLQKRKYLPVE